MESVGDLLITWGKYSNYSQSNQDAELRYKTYFHETKSDMN